jgi:hypothetical protein
MRKACRQAACKRMLYRRAVVCQRPVRCRDEYLEAMERRRRYVPDIEIITYDKILETQAAQMGRIVIPDLDESPIRLGRSSSRAFRL